MNIQVPFTRQAKHVTNPLKSGTVPINFETDRVFLCKSYGYRATFNGVRTIKFCLSCKEALERQISKTSQLTQTFFFRVLLTNPITGFEITCPPAYRPAVTPRGVLHSVKIKLTWLLIVVVVVLVVVGVVVVVVVPFLTAKIPVEQISSKAEPNKLREWRTRDIQTSPQFKNNGLLII